VKVLITADHPLMLAGIRRALERSENIEVVGEAHSATEAMGLVERRRPDVDLMDLHMPGIQGSEHIEQVCRTWPEVKVVVLSATEDRSSIDSALNAGASAFVVQSVSSSEIAGIVRQVATGVVCHAPSRRSGSRNGSAESEGSDLTKQQRSILSAAARGLTTPEIGRELWISEHTVKFHLTNVYRKVGVSNRAGAVRYALVHGLAES